MPERKSPGPTLDTVLTEFLAEQKARWSPGTFAKYETVTDLLKAYLERYRPGHDGESDRATKTGGTYCGTCGPADLAREFGMFLDYFLPNKVICGPGTEKAAGVVIRKLAKWLVAKGYDPHATDAID